MKLRGQEERLGRLIAVLIRIIGWTLRFEIEDRAGVLDPAVKQSMIWIFWHNRMLALPLLRNRFVRHRNGCALTSPSGDGAIIAAVMKSFDIGSVRGSSSRRGAGRSLNWRRRSRAGATLRLLPMGRAARATNWARALSSWRSRPGLEFSRFTLNIPALSA